jgi:S1-C subfamily serine protease
LRERQNISRIGGITVKKFGWILLNTTIAIICMSVLAFCRPVKSSLDNARDMTVLVTNVGFTGMGAGTGVLLDSTHVLTCFHMAETERDDFMIYTYPLGRVVEAHVEGGNKANDLLILVLDSSVPVSNVPVFQDKVEIGEPITVVGNALGAMQWFVTKGIISGESQGFLLTDALINPGNSGGPWLNEKGEIVALTDWGIGPIPHIHGLSGGISGRVIKRLLAARDAQNDIQVMMKALLGGQ